jgi:tRNA/tmRNA/rRNA uracil-C5-methylase (TrmA/RlmC/RlmD family)
MSETVRVTIERPATGGGVGRLDDGRVIFVRHALPGETVDALVTEERPSFLRGEALDILSASPHRVEPPCPYARPGECGGCDLQHAGTEAQSAWKSALVAEHLRRIARVDAEVEIEQPPSRAQRSRTRLRCGVDANGRLGLRAVRSNDIVPITDCWLASERFAPAFERTWHGIDEVELRDIGGGQPLAVVTKRRDRDIVTDVRDVYGKSIDAARSRVAVHGHHYEVSPLSFWQSHRDAPELLVDAVLDGAAVSAGDAVVDLFSGVGLFSVPLAAATGRGGSMRAVETSPHAVRDARRNLDDVAQARVRQSRVDAKVIRQEVSAGSVVVLDPPRTGLARGVAEALLESQAKRLVYVSCDPATFARDLAVLLRGYDVTDLRAFDLFPMTEHVELVAVLDSGAE